MKNTRRELLKLTGLALAGSMAPVAGFSERINRSSADRPSSFNPDTGEWNIAWPGKISQYDLVYKSPPIDPFQGIPLGNGDAGVLIWCEESRIIAAVNKCDLWDDAAFESFHNWDAKEEDYSTTLRHACRIIIDFKMPVFSTLFLADFDGRLSIKDGVCVMQASGPFGKVLFQAFVDRETGALFYDLKTDFLEDSPVEVAMERFGSRTFSHWYSQINGDASIGTSGTEALVDQEGIYITQKLATLQFAVGGTVLFNQGGEVTYLKEHSRRASIVLGNRSKSETRLVFVISRPDQKMLLEETKSSMRRIKQNGITFYQQSNEASWKTIWNRSFMDYGDEYLTNLWYLTMYYSLTSQGGSYPGRFNNGLWAWSRDVQNWNFYFHWNQQQLFWPLNAAGHHDAVMPYLDFRFRSLPQAQEDARRFFKAEGAFVSDVTDRRGFNSMGEHHNHTPVAEIALDFWRQYQFTQDLNFLKEKALPFMIAAARFFSTLLEKESDGLYHAKEGTGYEGWIKLKDGLTELVYTKALLTATLTALKTAKQTLPESAKWTDIITHLAPLPLVKSPSISADSGSFVLQRGQFRLQQVGSDQVVAAGWGIKEKKWLTTYHEADNAKYSGFNLLDGIFPTVPSSPVFPSNLVGLSDRENNRQLYEVMKSTTLLYPAGVTGWDPVPIVMARLGLGKELATVLARFPERWQIYCNGWGHWGMEGEINKDAEYFFRTNQVRDVSPSSARKDKFPLPMWPFRHMSMESMAVLATAINESLLQGHDGILRIAPAFASEKMARFTLHAVGSFKVSAEKNHGKVRWISIESGGGKECRIELPWEKAAIYANRKKINYVTQGSIATFKTERGIRYLLLPEGVVAASVFGGSESPEANQKARFHASGKVQLGLPRMF